MRKYPILDFFRKNQNISALFICSTGIYLNILLYKLVTVLGLPLYLDTVGTIIVATIGGFLPGVLVGFFTNIIKSFNEPASMYYGVLNVIIAVTATVIATRSFKKNWHRILVSIASYAFIGGGVGALIPWFMEGITFDSEPLGIILYNAGLSNIFFAHFFASLIMDIPDKILTVLLVEIIIRFIPKKFYRYASFCMCGCRSLS